MSLITKAGFFYFLWVFGLGMLLGTARTLVLAPVFGELIAVLIELPVILLFAWIVCARLTGRMEIPGDLWSRAGMGAIAFALLMAAELILSLWISGSTVVAHLDHYRTAHGALGLAGQVAFATFPLLQRRRGH